jgi:hypothetical protein
MQLYLLWFLERMTDNHSFLYNVILQTITAPLQRQTAEHLGVNVLIYKAAAAQRPQIDKYCYTAYVEDVDTLVPR